MPGHRPSFVNASLWQRPQACTLMSTCPGPGLGISRSTISKSAPGLGTCAAFIGATANFVVAMLPPLICNPWCLKLLLERAQQRLRRNARPVRPVAVVDLALNERDVPATFG